MIRRLRPLILIHLVGDALLLWLGYLWLGTSEATTARLLWSGVSALLLLLAALWLTGATLVYFREGGDLRPAFVRTLHHLLPLLLLALLAWSLYALLDVWQAFSQRPAFAIASWLTLHLRRPVKPEGVMRVFNVMLWIVRWAVLPVLLLPAAASIAENGWSGFVRRVGSRSRRWIYWAEVTLLVPAAFWLPFVLLRWIPKMPNFGLEMLSFVVRFGVGYLCFVASLIALSFVTSSGRPRSSQPSTVVSP